MKNGLPQRTAVVQRPKMERPGEQALAAARARVIAAGVPSLGELDAKFSSFKCVEASGKVPKS